MYKKRMDDEQNPIEEYKKRTREALSAIVEPLNTLVEPLSEKNAPEGMEKRYATIYERIRHYILRLGSKFKDCSIDLNPSDASQDARMRVQEFIAACEHAANGLRWLTKRERERLKPLVTEEGIEPLLACLEAIKRPSINRLHSMGGPIAELALEIDLRQLWFVGIYDEYSMIFGNIVSALNAEGDEGSLNKISSDIMGDLNAASWFQNVEAPTTAPAEARASFAQQKADFIEAMNSKGYPLSDPRNAEIFAPLLEKLDRAMEICDWHINKDRGRG